MTDNSLVLLTDCGLGTVIPVVKAVLHSDCSLLALTLFARDYLLNTARELLVTEDREKRRKETRSRSKLPQ